MQPLGQLLASVVGLAVLLTVGRNAGLANLPNSGDNPGQKVVDRIWRYVVGVGAIPALVAIVFRLTIPESPRYTLDVDHDGARALRDTQKYYNLHRTSLNGNMGETIQVFTDDVEDGAGIQQIPRAAISGDVNGGTQLNDAPHEDIGHHVPPQDDDDSMEIQELVEADSQDQGNTLKSAMPDPFSFAEIRQFFWTEGNIKYLLGTSITWFLLDFAFCKSVVHDGKFPKRTANGTQDVFSG